MGGFAAREGGSNVRCGPGSDRTLKDSLRRCGLSAGPLYATPFRLRALSRSSLYFSQYFQTPPRCPPNAVAKETIIYPLIVQEMSREPFVLDALLICRYTSPFKFSVYVTVLHALAPAQELEQRVMELEEENSALRIALNLPPASRPSLGKGPTGKDKPRALEGSSRSYPSSAKSRESSNADLDSPPSTRTHSLSPSAMTSVRPSPRSAPALESGGTWDQSLLMGEQHDDGQGGSTTYPLPPVSTSMPQKGVHQYTFSDPMPPNPRSGMGSSMYIGSQQSHYSPTTERPMTSTYNSAGYIARDSRDESQYSYSPTQYPNHDSPMQSHSPTTNTTHHSQIHHSRESLPTQSNVSYSQRRSNTEPHSFRAVLSQQHPHLPHPMQLNNSIRLPSPHGLPDSGPSSQRPPSHYGGVEGRLSSMP